MSTSRQPLRRGNDRLKSIQSFKPVLHPGVDRELARARVDDAIGHLSLPPRPSFTDIVRAVENRTGLTIVVTAIPLTMGTRYCGLNITAGGEALVHYKEGQPGGPLQSVCHEFGHGVMEHRTLDANNTGASALDRASQLATALMKEFAIDSDSLHTDSGSSKPAFGQQNEYEAETFAYALRALINKPTSRVVALF